MAVKTAPNKSTIQTASSFFQVLVLLPFLIIHLEAFSQEEPLKVGIAGLTHTHVHWILGREDRGDIKLVGIVEPNRELAERYAAQHGFSMDLVYDSLDDMISGAKPEAVLAFGTIYAHLSVVQKCAPLGIHVMVEKPLAVSLEHAREMEKLANLHQIHLLTNYETTWYPTNHKAREVLLSGQVGEMRKVVVRDGHRGPKKIGINREFLDWLTDPELNGGGALMDFGCYGANLLTWLREGERPHSVTAVTQQLQAENNPKVDDDATLFLKYKDANAVIQASWNWPIGRKDMVIYGELGAIYSDNRQDLRIRLAEGYDGYNEEAIQLEERPSPYDDPFALLAGVIRGKVTLLPWDLSSLENNMLVMEILDAAHKSAQEGRTIRLDE